MVELCEVSAGTLTVEESTGFMVYQIIFVAMYLTLFFLTLWALFSSYREAKAAGAKWDLSNNRSQVIIFLSCGTLIRAISFSSNNCVFEEIFRSLKDIFFVLAFVEVVLFWIELQKFMQQMKSVQKLRPYLIGIMIIYSIFRVLASLAALFIGKTVKNILLGLCNLVYVFIMGLGLIYGGSLLKKMSKMSRSDMKARLAKLTRFIVLEIGILFLFLIAFLVRNGLFSKKKDEDPWLWFYLKLIEKVLEFLCICVLCLTMTLKPAAKKSSGSSKNKKPRGRGSTTSEMTRRSSANGGAAGAGAGASNAEPPKRVQWVKVPQDAESGVAKAYFFHPVSKQTVWKLPSGSGKAMTLAAYKKQQAKDSADANTTVNPLNGGVASDGIPPPPSK